MTTAQTESAPDAPEALLEDPNSPLVIAGQILCVLLPLAVWFAPLPLAPATKHGFAIVGFMVVAWITRAMDYALAGFIGCFLFWALGIVKFPVAFSGFANDTAWFLFGAIIGMGVGLFALLPRVGILDFIIHAGHMHSAAEFLPTDVFSSPLSGVWAGGSWSPINPAWMFSLLRRCSPGWHPHMDAGNLVELDRQVFMVPFYWTVDRTSMFPGGGRARASRTDPAVPPAL